MPLPKPSSCLGCPRSSSGKGFVPSEFPPEARVLFVGGGPSQDEFLDARMFTGAVGRKLDYWITAAGLDRRECALTHVVQCWIQGATPTAEAIAFCHHQHRAHWIGTLPTGTVVVPLGIDATKYILGPRVKETSIGVRARAEVGGVPRTVLPLLHPTDIVRGRWSDEPAQIAYLKQVKDILNGTQRHTPDDFTAPAPIRGKYIPTPGLGELDTFRASIGPNGLAVDLETAGDHLRCVGLYGCDAGWYLSFPVRDVGGAQYWSAADLPIAVEWLWDLLSDPGISKLFHNGQAFDVPVLERNGFVVNGYDFDTMLAAHVAYPGTPKGLEDLSKVYLRVGGWKALVKDAEGDGK